MAKTLYTAEAHVSGGRLEGHGSTASGNLEVDIRIPQEVGGDGTGTNPEELFAVGFGACFDNAVATVARRKKVELTSSSIDSKVSLLAGEDRSFKLAVRLDVRLEGVSDEQAADIVSSAHRTCPYSNATRGNVEVELTANGRPVG